MNIKILYDNNAQNGFKAGWGFSCLVETCGEKILFDTGWNGNILLHNMKIAGINPQEIDKIVISHSHWDHIGGLNHILNYAKKADVYVPQSISKNLKNEIKSHVNVIEVFKAQKIYEDVWTTGEMGEEIKEQSLILRTSKGNLVLTGCAHPGLESIIRKFRELGDIYAVMGGFHDSDIGILRGIPVLMPCHCTEKMEEIKQKMPQSYRYCEVGFEFDEI